MRLAQLSVENFRTLPDLSLDVRGDLVLVGPNDSGKTSVLVALDYLLGMPTQQLVSALSPAELGDSNRPLVVEATLVEFSDDERAAFADEISTVDGEKLRVRLEASLNVADPSVCEVQRYFPDGPTPRAPTHHQLDAIGWEYVSATRSLFRELGSARSGVVGTLMRGIDLGADLEEVKAQLDALEAVVDQAASIADFRSQLAQALTDVLPSEVSPDSIKVMLPGRLSDNPLADAQVGLTVHGSTRPITEQSDGVRALATIAAYGLVHFGANIVAIDEPEMHLHPSAQKLIASILRRSTTQSVIATHSSHVVSETDPLDIVVIHRRRPAVQASPSAKAASYEFAARWWEDTFVQPLTATSVIAVEGPSERLLVTAAARVQGLSLHRSGIHIFDLGGAPQFGNAYAAFGPPGFGVSIFGLVDEDHRKTWAKVLGVAPADLEAEGYRVCAPDLEGEVVDGLGTTRVIELLVAGGLATEARILKTLGAPDAGSVPAVDLAALLRNGKVRMWTAISRALDPRDAAQLTKITDVLSLAAQ
jgi:putative ATP-dependent endonuclease of OLD family